MNGYIQGVRQPPEITEQIVNQPLDLALALLAINEQSAGHKYPVTIFEHHSIVATVNHIRKPEATILPGLLE